MHTLIVGGGMIGLMTAYHLAREGEQVTLLDARKTGLGASEVNAGWFCPAESAPVPGPGVVLTSMKWMLKPDSPLYIRPSLRPSFVRFMLGMWMKSNARDQRAGFEASMQLAQNTGLLYEEYRKEMGFEMHSDGLLMAFTEKVNLEHHLDNLDLVNKFNLEPQVLIGDDVRAYEPELTDAVYGGIAFPHEKHIDPVAMMAAFRQQVAALGVEVVENTPVDAVRFNGDSVVSVASNGETFTADRFVLSAGAWTGKLSRLFRNPLPVRPGKGYSLEVEPLKLRGAINLSDAKVAVTPFTERLRLAGTMEFGGLDEEVNRVRVDAILRAPQTYFRTWRHPATTSQPKAGMRPMTPDGLPIIGRLGALKNAWVSTGHGMMGITLGAGTARELSGLILRNTPSSALAPFSPKRFGA